MRGPVLASAWAGLLSAAVLTAGCGNTDSRAAGEAAIRDLVDRTVAAAGRGDMTTYMKFYAPDAALVLPGLPITAVRIPSKQGFAPGYAIRMVTIKAGVSQTGDFGYAFGTYEQTAPDKSGALVHSVGKWMDVFRKQADGSWGAIADTYNVDPPP